MGIVYICAMEIKNLNKPHWITNLWLLLVASLTVMVVVPTNTIFGHFLSTHATGMMFAFLGVGFVGFVFRNNWLIFSNFLACIVLCSFIKESSTQQLSNGSPIEDVQIRVAHFVLENEQEVERFGDSFSDLNANFVSIQTPVESAVAQKLTKKLSHKMPYSRKTVCNNGIKLLVFSKYELRDFGTLYYQGNNTVSLVGSMFIDSLHKEISFLSTRLPVDKEFRKETEQHLAELSRYIDQNSQNKPLLTLSSMRLTSWSPAVQDLSNTNELNDEVNVDFSNQEEHIFYSKDLLCIGFDKVLGGNGVIGTYQFSDAESNNPLRVRSAYSIHSNREEASL